jgi:hypothetical protein
MPYYKLEFTVMNSKGRSTEWSWTTFKALSQYLLCQDSWPPHQAVGHKVHTRVELCVCVCVCVYKERQRENLQKRNENPPGKISFIS